jgi:hypothetical protein
VGGVDGKESASGDLVDATMYCSFRTSYILKSA